MRKLPYINRNANQLNVKSVDLQMTPRDFGFQNDLTSKAKQHIRYKNLSTKFSISKIGNKLMQEKRMYNTFYTPRSTDTN